ncbi:MAG: hypothetical protein ACPHRO_07485, partial [Nannocystaceae bacterium]
MSGTPTFPANDLPLDQLEKLRTSNDHDEIKKATSWLKTNFEPWMFEIFGHRLYEQNAEVTMRETASFLSARDDISVEDRLAAALVASCATPEIPATSTEGTEERVWMSALQGAMRAEARKAIVRVPDLGCENLLKYWNRLSVPDRRWAVGRLGTLDVQRRVDLLVLGLNDRSEVVVVEALTVLERARELLGAGRPASETLRLPLAERAGQCCGGEVTLLLEAWT